MQDRSAWTAAGVKLPAYDWRELREATEQNPVWVHFGGGNIFRGFIARLQQELLKNDCYIPGLRNQDPEDLAPRARVSASSQQPGYEAGQVLSGIARTEEGGEVNLWRSQAMGPEGERLRLDWSEPVSIGQVRLTLDPDLSEERCISVSKAFLDKEPVGVPVTLLRDYTLTAYREGKAVWSRRVEGNYQRLNVLDFPETPLCDSIEVRVTATNGYANARVFEVRAYE